MAQLVLKATQQCPLEVTGITDKKGNPAQVQNPVWTGSDDAIATVTTDAANPLKAVVKATGPVGAMLVTLTADADMGDGVAPIIATQDVAVIAGNAVAMEITAGTPEEQPDAAAAARRR